MTEALIEIKNLSIRLNNEMIHHGLNLTIRRGEILGIVGGSGSGKTTLMREILMLQPPDAGSIKVFNQEVTTLSEEKFLNIQHRWSVLFQQNALFSSLTVLENVAFPLREKYSLESKLIDEIALQKILAVGLEIDSANKYPAELSGGMQKRAALARAIALDPELLFLDEPTGGLDPESASLLDNLILELHDAMNLTIVVITHDLDTLWHITDRVAFLHEGKVLTVEPLETLIKNPHQAIQDFFNGPRGRAAKLTDEKSHGNKS